MKEDSGLLDDQVIKLNTFISWVGFLVVASFGFLFIQLVPNIETTLCKEETSQSNTVVESRARDLGLDYYEIDNINESNVDLILLDNELKESVKNDKPTRIIQIQNLTGDIDTKEYIIPK